ncbi:hypothetical protein BDV12DRAFT_207924 [Aspergillus spectabilis]
MSQNQTTFRLTGERTSIQALQQHTEQIPIPSKHGMLFKVHSVSLNYRDHAVATSKHPFPVKDKVVPCSGAAGVAVQVGDAVKNFTEDDHVVGSFDPTNLYGQMTDWSSGQGGPADGVLREYVVIPAAAAAKRSFSEWSTLVCTGVMVWNALYGNLPLRPGQSVLCLGTGGVSITGLILAKAAGATTIITSSSEEKLALVKSQIGADHRINYKTHPEWSKEVLKLTNGEGVDYIIESGGSGAIKESLDAVKMGGTVSVVGFLSAAAKSELPDVASLALTKAAFVRGITIGSTQLLEDVVRFVAQIGLHLLVKREFGITMASRSRIGKVRIKVSE